jgi:16S rRNA processing protein RimM
LQDGKGGWVRREVGEARAHSGTVVASLDGLATPEDAKLLKGRDVAVPRSALPKPGRGEVYLADLVGLDVVGASGARLGTVVAVEEYGAHPLMRVAPAGAAPGEGRLVPFVEPIVRAVDLRARRIEVEWEPEY